MSRLLDDFLYRTSLLTRVRGKCGGDRETGDGARHESVCLVDGEWRGEDSGSYECPHAPQDPCPACNGAGEVEVSASEAALAQYDGNGPETKRPCIPCGGSGYVSGPHWPYRFPEPPPLRART